MESILSVLPEFYAHISNFSISYFLFAGIGYFWLMAGANFKFIIGLGSVILLSNFIFELFIDVLNTPDIIDAYYGLAGVVFAFVFLILTQKFGLTVNSMAADTVRELD